MKPTDAAVWREFGQELGLLVRRYAGRYWRRRYRFDPGSLILVPTDFPVGPYRGVGQLASNRSGGNPELFGHHAAAWNALLHRYRSLADHDEAYTAWIEKHGAVARPAYALHLQQRELFGFLASGLSAIESFCYGLYMLGAMAAPGSFPTDTAKALRRITPESTREKFDRAFPTEVITRTVGDVLDSSEYAELRDLRNVLVHRVAPSRTTHVGGPRDGEVEWQRAIAEDVPVPGGGGATRIVWTSLTIDRSTTASRRVWLGRSFRDLLNATEAFAASHL